MAPVHSAAGVHPANVYLADLILPFGPGGFGLSVKQIMEFAGPAGGPFQMLLGRDVLCDGVLTVNFDGTFTFCL